MVKEMNLKRGMGKGWKVLIIVAIIVLLLVGGYFGVKTYKNFRDNRNLNIFKQGFSYGYTSAVLQVMNISDNCQPFPVYVGNETRTLINVDCLNKTV